MRRCTLLLLAAVVGLPALAFAQEEVDFRAMMQETSTTYVSLVKDYPFQYITPDGFWKDDVAFNQHPDYDEFEHEWVPPCDNNLNGIPDVIELGVVEEILNNASHPLHADLFAAFTANADQLALDLGGLQGSLAPLLNQVLAGYVILGDGSYESATIGATRYGWGFAGSWGIVAESIYEIAGYGSAWKTGAPDPANYERFAESMSACGNADGDSIPNLNEFYGNGGVYTGVAPNPDNQNDDLTLSLAAEAAYVAAALSSGTATDGGDPAGVCEGGGGPTGWAWGENIFYYPANNYVYAVGPVMPWIPGRQWAQTMFTVGAEKVAVAGELASIDSEALNDWIVDTIMPLVDSDMLTGGTDKDKEGDWKWVATDELFWVGKADGAAPAGAWANWSGGEPNDSSGEDICEIKPSGTWNDNDYDEDEPILVEFSNGGVGYADGNGNGYPDWWETYIPVPSGVHADFTAVPTSGDMPLTVQFTDASTCDADGYTITGWEWDFGDGDTSTLEDPSHEYVATQEPSSTYTVTLTVTATKAGEDDLTNSKNTTITVNYVCEWTLNIEAQAAVVAGDPSAFGGSFAAAVGSTPYSQWDLDADTLPDAASVALVSYVACKPTHGLSASVVADLEANTAAWEAIFTTGALNDNSVFFAALAGVSAEMRTALGGYFGQDLSGLDLYGSAKAGERFSATGDLDNDGLDNVTEYDQVMAAGGDLETFVMAATDPNNFWPGNPDLPIAGIVGLGLLAGSILTGAAFALRKK